MLAQVRAFGYAGVRAEGCSPVWSNASASASCACGLARVVWRVCGMLATTTAAILRLLLRLPDCYVDRYVDLDYVTATCYVYVIHVFVIVVDVFVYVNV